MSIVSLCVLFSNNFEHSVFFNASSIVDIFLQVFILPLKSLIQYFLIQFSTLYFYLALTVQLFEFYGKRGRLDNIQFWERCLLM